MDGDNNKVDQSERLFYVVFIPSSDLEEIQQIQVLQKKGEALSAMLWYAKLHFAQTGLNPAQQQMLAAQMKQNTPDARDDMVNQIVNMTMCEIVPLVPNQRPFGFIAVNLVVDDKALSKNLAPNKRASSLARMCGLDIQVLGDAFVSRQFDDDDGFKRLDFTLKDLNSDAEWIKVVRTHRLKGAAPVTAVVAQHVAPDIEAKNKGNSYFAQKEYNKAIEEYHKAEKLTTNVDVIGTIKANLAACYHALGEFELSLDEAELSTRMKPNWSKAWGRKGDALRAMGRHDEAREAFGKGLTLAPDSLELQSRWESCGDGNKNNT